MNKDKKRTVKPEGKIKHMLRTNYWLTPLLLVALVFAIVFGISKIPALKTTIQGWFKSHDKCKQCEMVSFDEFQEQIKANTGDNKKDIYVLFSEADNEAAKSLYPKLDKFLETNNKNKEIIIINVDLSKKDNEFVDKTISDDEYEIFKKEFEDQLNEGVLSAPTIIKYDSNKMEKALVGDKDYSAIMDFFDINY